METSRIAELLRPFLTTPLTEAQLDNISTYVDLLLRWNARINLTAVRQPEEIVTRHFGESLFAAQHLLSVDELPTAQPDAQFRMPTADPVASSEPAAERQQNTAHGASRESKAEPNEAPQERKNTVSETRHLIDLGSGAGFPGLPIKIWRSNLRLTLIESNQKKATFLREVVRSLALTDVAVFGERAESYSGDCADVVTLRAVERFAEALPVAARLAAPAGRLALLIGEGQLVTARESLPHYKWDKPLPIPLSASRVFFVGRAVGEPE